MAVLASNQIPADAYAEFKRICVRIDGRCAEWTALLAANIDADTVWQWYRELNWAFTRISEIGAVPGIVEYAVAQEGDPDYDIVAEFGTMMTQLGTAKDWLYAAIPRDLDGYILTHKTTTAGEITARVYTPAESAAFIPYLDAIAAAII
jgi:hypothetical protein